MAEEGLRKGIHPVILPTTEEVAAAKARVQYQDGLFHFAVAGVAGSGKSSLVNAIRARTGVVETTSSIGRYPDPDPKHPFVWYDIPEAGTLAQSDCQYFNNQGLFAFDCIVVLLDNRFTQIDVAILTNCRRFQIPTYIVRLKADVHIDNIIADMKCADDEEDDDSTREQFIAARRSIVESNLRDAKLPEQRVYCISKKALLSIKKGKLLPEAIDEVEFIQDILKEAQSRRCVPRS
ncbi:interferon-inducible GTPase-domain-containing protein [Scleroderma yunnanense]